MKIFITFLSILITYFLFYIQQVNAFSNTWRECNDNISCGAKEAGFNFPLRVTNYNVKAKAGMMEISFPLDKKRIAKVRKAQEYNGQIVSNGIIDISEDDNNYKINKTTYLKNGISFWTRGKKNRFYVAAFAAESGFYSIYCKKGLKIKDLEYFYKLLEEAEAPRYNYDKTETLTIEELQNLRRVDGIVEPVYSQDNLSNDLIKKGVSQKCFERANLGADSFCSASEIKMIKEYYIK